MSARWVVPVLLAIAAPSGFSGSASAGFGIGIRLLAPGNGARSGPPGGGSGEHAVSVITCSSAAGASSVQVHCNLPTFVDISEVEASANGAPPDPCGGLSAAPGVTCTTYGGRSIAQQAGEGVSLMSAESAIRLGPDAGSAGVAGGPVYEIQRRDSLSTLVAVQAVNPDSRTVELLVTF
ncbi:hypothetical protein EZ313_07830 [Ramlibacter henchirensis]|uniref:Spore coat protein U domain-containing protein n=1 Tax=Ramlibacter henchirensis TaxID=204072 RepID=A0A4Z0C4Q6_9BURK|nr:hypothetical protein [Ramlibacter henchirensis]TFZ06533.1 hypothetical protein EZ313_07830 [Ramlibacter henchirensis]